MNKRNLTNSSEDIGVNLRLTLSESSIKAILALAGALLLGSGIFLNNDTKGLVSPNPLLENSNLSHK